MVLLSGRRKKDTIGTTHSITPADDDGWDCELEVEAVAPFREE